METIENVEQYVLGNTRKTIFLKNSSPHKLPPKSPKEVSEQIPASYSKLN